MSTTTTKPAAEATVKHASCGKCGYVFAAPQKAGTCQSDAACKARKAIRAAEKRAGLDQTVFDAKNVRKQTVLAKQRLAEHAKAEKEASAA